MQNKLFFVALILVAVFSFLAGKYFTHSKKSSEYIDALVTTVNLSSDRWNEIKLLTVLYEASLQDKETAKFLNISFLFEESMFSFLPDFLCLMLSISVNLKDQLMSGLLEASAPRSFPVLIHVLRVHL